MDRVDRNNAHSSRKTVTKKRAPRRMSNTARVFHLIAVLTLFTSSAGPGFVSIAQAAGGAELPPSDIDPTYQPSPTPTEDPTETPSPGPSGTTTAPPLPTIEPGVTLTPRPMPTIPSTG